MKGLLSTGVEKYSQMNHHSGCLALLVNSLSIVVCVSPSIRNVSRPRGSIQALFMFGVLLSLENRIHHISKNMAMNAVWHEKL